MPNPQPITRGVDVSVTPITFSTSLASSTAISFGRGSALSFTTPAVASGAITWYASTSQDGTYTPVILSSGLAAQTLNLAANTTYIAPPELFATAYLKGVASVAPLLCSVCVKH